jgi:hypothetical protein
MMDLSAALTLCSRNSNSKSTTHIFATTPTMEAGRLEEKLRT